MTPRTFDSDAVPRRVVDLVAALPPPPHSIHVLQTTGDDVPASALRDLVAGDPGLTADVLMLANLPHDDGVGGAITTVDEALAHVGVDELRLFAAAHYGLEAVRAHCGALTDYDRYVDHVRMVARTCHALAAAAGLPAVEAERLAVAGMLHDMGRLVIMVAAERSRAPLLGMCCRDLGAAIDDERAVLGLDHCTVGASLCERWAFPEYLGEAVLRHHDPMVGDDECCRPAAFVFVAHFVAMSDLTGEALSRMLRPSLLKAAGLTGAMLVRAKVMLEGWTPAG